MEVEKARIADDVPNPREACITVEVEEKMMDEKKQKKSTCRSFWLKIFLCLLAILTVAYFIVGWLLIDVSFSATYDYLVKSEPQRYGHWLLTLAAILLGVSLCACGCFNLSALFSCYEKEFGTGDGLMKYSAFLSRYLACSLLFKKAVELLYPVTGKYTWNVQNSTWVGSMANVTTPGAVAGEPWDPSWIVIVSNRMVALEGEY